MTIRLFGALLCGAALMLATQTDLAQAQKDTGATTRATTVKSSKSNTSDRMGGGGGKGTTLRTTTPKLQDIVITSRAKNGGMSGTKRASVYTCMTDDGYGRKRPCSAGYKAANPNWRATKACFTDDGNGRFRPCSAG